MGESTGFGQTLSGNLRLNLGPWDAFLAQAAAYRERFERDETALTQDEAVEAYRLVAPLYDPDPDPDKAERYACVRRFSYKSERTGRTCFNVETIRDMLTAFEAEHAGGVAVRAPDSILADKWGRYLALRFLQRLVNEDLVTYPNATLRECIARAVPILDRERPVTRPRGRYNPAINDGRDLFIRGCIEALEGCGLPVTSGGDGGSLAGALAEVLDLPRAHHQEGLGRVAASGALRERHGARRVPSSREPDPAPARVLRRWPALCRVRPGREGAEIPGGRGRKPSVPVLPPCVRRVLLGGTDAPGKICN